MKPVLEHGYTPACAATHMGLWMIYAPWFSRAFTAVKAGQWPRRNDGASGRDAHKVDIPEWGCSGFFVAGKPSKDPAPAVAYALDDAGIAHIAITGAIMKGDSKFGGTTSSVRTRQAVRQAVKDPDVKGILLSIDSPGGMVAGTGELAAEVARAKAIKPVWAQFDDLTASAAYWVGSQASRIAATPTTEVGSIGTYAVIEDVSGAYEMAGIQVHVISTGPHKGSFVEGAPVTKDALKQVQTEVDDLNEQFLHGVMNGRGMSRAALDEVADGRVFIAAKALKAGLIDAVQSIDQTAAEMAASFSSTGPLRRNRAETAIRILNV